MSVWWLLFIVPVCVAAGVLISGMLQSGTWDDAYQAGWDARGRSVL